MTIAKKRGRNLSKLKSKAIAIQRIAEEKRNLPLCKKRMKYIPLKDSKIPLGGGDGPPSARTKGPQQKGKSS